MKSYRRSERLFSFLTDIVDIKTVLDVLREKHGEPSETKLNYLVTNDHPKSLPYHQSIFEKLNASMNGKSATMRHGSHGPSSLDAKEWPRLLNSFKFSSTDLCKTIAKLAIRIATSHLIFNLPYKSCRLIALDKCPGVQPIGIGEIFRPIIGINFVKRVKTELKTLCGDQQLCTGQKGGIKHAINFLRAPFKETHSEAILLMGAKNTFCRINCDLFL